MDPLTTKKEDRRVRYTKQAIREGFLRLIAQKPIEKISVTEICREADINRGTFYAHYTDPYELKASIENELTTAMEQRRRELGLTRINTLQMLRLLKENEELCRIFSGPYGDKASLRKIIERQADIYLAQEISNRCNLNEQTFQCLKLLLVSSISTVVKYWFDTGLEAQPERVAYVLETYCTKGAFGFIDNDRFT